MGARSRAPLLRDEPEQPGSALQGQGRTCQGVASVSAGTATAQGGAGSQAPLLRQQPEQPGSALQGDGRTCQGVASVSAGTATAPGGARSQAPLLREQPEQPGLPLSGDGKAWSGGGVGGSSARGPTGASARQLLRTLRPPAP